MEIPYTVELVTMGPVPPSMFTSINEVLLAEQYVVLVPDKLLL